MGIKLRAAGITDFVILEKQADVGGTWCLNRYPGVACDVPAHGYGFSFERNPDWSTAYAPGSEIHQYQKRVANKHGVTQHCRFGVEVTALVYDPAAQRWNVTATNVASQVAQTFTSRLVVACMGVQHWPAWPKLNGVNNGTFKGDLEVHSVEWVPGQHDAAIEGKNVVVIGSACSALQLVPAIADKVKSLTVVQRTPSWIVPKRNPLLPSGLQYGPVWKSAFNNVPGALWAYNRAIYLSYESFYLVASGTEDSFVQRKLREVLTRSMTDQLSGRADLVDALIPKYPIGCKRPVMSDDFLPTLLKPNVRLVNSPLHEIKDHSVVCANGQSINADVIIYCTGYRFSDPGPRFNVKTPFFEYTDSMRAEAERTGAWDGVNVPASVFDKMRMYKGVAHPWMPNFFTTFGPNSGLINSIVVVLEAQVAYIVGAIEQMQRQRVAELRIKQHVVDAYTQEIDQLLDSDAFSAFSSTTCSSYYKADGKGKIVAASPYSARQFTAHLAPPSSLTDYHVAYLPPPQRKAAKL